MNGRETATRRVAGRRDPLLSAVVIRRTPLYYCEGPDVNQDRPGHVRAGSSLAWVGERLALVQDDANFLAFVEPGSGRVEAVSLPCGEGGARQFDDLRGTKHLKLDLEACVAVPAIAGPMLLAFGSGSTPRRETIAAIGLGDVPQVTLLHAADFYRRLREETAFAGSELNLEGAILVDDRLRLLNRGNGAPRERIAPVNATLEFRWSEFATWIERRFATALPQPGAVVQYDLGELEGQRLGFTDAALTSLGLLYSAAAEDSPDAVGDGRVTGSAVGILDDEQLRWTELRTTSKDIFRCKVEGICAAQDADDRLYAVIDGDDPRLPSELCEVELRGPWRR